MLNENKEVAEKYNLLQWHEKGYTGKGIRIALFDQGAYIRENMKSYCTCPFNERDSAPTHGSNVAAVIHEFAPEAQIFILRFLNASLEEQIRNAKWIADPANKIDLISCSCIMGTDKDTENHWKVLKDSGIPTFCAAGNGGDEKDKNDVYAPASYDWTYAIGGIAEALEAKVCYSNYGDFLTCMTYASPYIQNETGRIYAVSGTSFCQPQACALAAIFLQVGKQYGIKHTRDSLLKLIAANCKDYYDAGNDIMSGYGLLVMPDVDEYLGGNDMEIKLTIGSQTAYVDGQAITLAVAPIISNGNTLVPLRFISENLGCKVAYNSATKEITITK